MKMLIGNLGWANGGRGGGWIKFRGPETSVAKPVFEGLKGGAFLKGHSEGRIVGVQAWQ